jgi:hypothetical protein
MKGTLYVIEEPGFSTVWLTGHDGMTRYMGRYGHN